VSELFSTPEEPAQADSWLVRAIERLSGIGSWIAAACVLMIMGLISVEVVMRYFGKSTMVSDEISGYLYAAIVFFGLAETLRCKAFIRLESVYDRMRGRVALAARWLCVLITMGYVSVLLGDAIRDVHYLYTTDVRSDSLLRTPLFLAHAVMVIGWSMLLLQLLTYVLRRMRDVP
jgi:TRAP-type C4-dicarboxylate transport system permease small subunit